MEKTCCSVMSKGAAMGLVNLRWGDDRQLGWLARERLQRERERGVACVVRSVLRS